MAAKSLTIEFSDRTAEIFCPACSTILVFCDVSGAKCIGCPDCRGMMLQGELFSAMVEALRAAYRGPNDLPKPLDPNRTIVHRDCPVCGTTMDTHPYYGPGNVEIDACRECKMVWVDNDELGRIVRAPGRR